MEGANIAFIYFLVGFIASTFGSVAGIGGGVIIKPALDLLGHYDVATIGILSAVCVFTMSLVSFIRATLSKLRVNFKVSSLLALASIIGGVLGKVIFNHLLQTVESSHSVSITQSIILSVIMLIIFIYTRNKHVINHYELDDTLTILFIGFCLGMIAAFLGIGGGPLNVAILTVVFSMSFKEASINSLFIILFSQLSSLITTKVTTGFAVFNLEMLPYIVAGGVIGGLVGATLLTRFNNKNVEMIFSIGILLILAINVFNAVKLILT